MKRFFCLSSASLLIAACIAFAVPTFVNSPVMTYNVSAQHWDISFQVSEYTDVEVAIVRLSDSSIVRHIAAGKLGPTAPAPLIAGSLTQALTWNGANDLGVPVTDTAALSVRVRAGLSVNLDKFTTPDFYHIGVQVYGVATDSAGNAYVQSTTGTMWTTTLRKYDAAGNYLMTVYPFPGTLSASSVNGYGINNWATGSSYSPQVTGSSSLTYSPTLVGNTGWLMSDLVNGQLGLFQVGGYPTTYLTLQTILPVGAMVDQKPLITSPALPYWRGVGGDPFLCPAPGKNYIYLSGIFETGQDQPYNLLNTFYKEGQIYRVNLQTGVVTSWLTMASVPFDTVTRHQVLGDQYLLFGAFRGMAVDDSGHVFVCDRINKRVAVYDTSANLLGSIPVPFPELVAVNRYNGAIYVMNAWLDTGPGNAKTHASLYKFSGWRAGFARVDSLMEFMSGVNDAFGATKRSKVFMSLAQSPTKPVIWCDGGNNVWNVADNGAKLNIQFDFISKQKAYQVGYDRVVVDRRSETVYINDGWDNIYKIEDWTRPVAVPCSTSAKKRLWGTDMAVSPSGMLYVREGNGSGAGDFSGPLTRYTLDHLHAPVPFKNSGTNVLSSYIYSRYGAGLGEKGFSVAPNGDVAVDYMSDWALYVIGLFGDSTNHSGDTACDTTKPWNNRVLSCLPGYPYPFSPRYDLQGNLYVGLGGVQPSGYTVPAGFAGDDVYKSHMGAIVRFPAGTKGCKEVSYSQFSCGNTKIYPFPMTSVWTACVCRSPRFDVDPYGRLFVPDFYHNQVTVSDNEGTVLAQFGHYGNVDSWGPGSPVPGVDIPLATPLAVAASDNYIYVDDMVNGRLVRLKMNYALENIHLPEMSAERKSPGGVFSLSSTPNPFTPASRITFALSSRSAVRLDVYTVTGQFVKTLKAGNAGVGPHQVVWDATDALNRPVSAGIYVYRLTAGGKVLTARTVLAK